MCGTCSAGWAFSAQIQGCNECADASAFLESFTLMCIGLVLVGLIYVIRTGDVYLPDWVRRSTISSNSPLLHFGVPHSLGS